MDTREREDRPAHIQGRDHIHPSALGHVRLAHLQEAESLVHRLIDVLYLGEPFEPQQLFCEVLGRQADRGGMHETDFLHLGRRLGRDRRPQTKQRSSTPSGRLGEEHATAIPFDTLVTHCFHGFTSFVMPLGRQDYTPCHSTSHCAASGALHTSDRLQANARCQPPLEAGATQERTLEAVGCTP